MEKKGIKLTTLVFVLIIVICIEGFYIIKLKSNKTISREKNNVISTNQEVKSEFENVKSNLENEANMQKSKVQTDKEYVSEQESGDTTTNSDVLKSLGYDIEIMANDILNNIEKYAAKSYIVKSTTGDANAEKITSEEVKNNKEKYKEKILELLNNKDIVTKLSFENNTVVCTYNFQEILKSLNLGSNMYKEMETDTEGYKTFKF